MPNGHDIDIENIPYAFSKVQETAELPPDISGLALNDMLYEGMSLGESIEGHLGWGEEEDPNHYEDIEDTDPEALEKAMYQSWIMEATGANPVMTPYGPALVDDEVQTMMDAYPGASAIMDDFDSYVDGWDGYFDDTEQIIAASDGVIDDLVDLADTNALYTGNLDTVDDLYTAIGEAVEADANDRVLSLPSLSADADDQALGIPFMAMGIGGTAELNVSDIVDEVKNAVKSIWNLGKGIVEDVGAASYAGWAAGAETQSDLLPNLQVQAEENHLNNLLGAELELDGYAEFRKSMYEAILGPDPWGTVEMYERFIAGMVESGRHRSGELVSVAVLSELSRDLEDIKAQVEENRIADLAPIAAQPTPTDEPLPLKGRGPLPDVAAQFPRTGPYTGMTAVEGPPGEERDFRKDFIRATLGGVRAGTGGWEFGEERDPEYFQDDGEPPFLFWPGEGGVFHPEPGEGLVMGREEGEPPLQPSPREERIRSLQQQGATRDGAVYIVDTGLEADTPANVILLNLMISDGMSPEAALDEVGGRNIPPAEPPGQPVIEPDAGLDPVTEPPSGDRVVVGDDLTVVEGGDLTQDRADDLVLTGAEVTGDTVSEYDDLSDTFLTRDQQSLKDKFAEVFNSKPGSGSFAAQDLLGTMYSDAELLYYLQVVPSSRSFTYPSLNVRSGDYTQESYWESEEASGVDRDEFAKHSEEFLKGNPYTDAFYKDVLDFKDSMYRFKGLSSDPVQGSEQKDLLGINELRDINNNYIQMRPGEQAADTMYLRHNFMNMGDGNARSRLATLVAIYNTPVGADRYIREKMKGDYKSMLTRWLSANRSPEDFIQAFIKPKKDDTTETR
jgi:hypothetical protein